MVCIDYIRYWENHVWVIGGTYMDIIVYVCCVDLILCIFVLYLNFVGVVHYKPSRDLTRPPGLPGGLKGLLHTLNAAVIPTKVS